MLEKLTPYMLYIKLGVVALVVGVVAYSGWHFRGLSVDKEKREAVDAATKDLTSKFNAETKLRQTYQTLAEGKLDAILQGVSNIKTVHTTVTNNITKEIQSNPQFYNQPLPAEGYKQWITARNLVNTAAGAQATSDGQPASAPVSSSQPH